MGRAFSWLDTRRLMVIILFASIFTMAVRTLLPPDMWWHLRCGQVQWAERTILRADIFSHTAAGRPWVNQSWLAQIGMWVLYSVGGYQALAVAVAVIVTLTFGFVFAQGETSPYLRAFVVLLAAVASARVWVPRPHLLTFLLSGILGYLLYLYKHQGRNLLWLLPPLFALWANVHGGYIVGFILVGCVILGEIGNHLLGVGERILSWRQILLLGGVAALSLAACLLNPQGYRLLLFPINTLSSTAQQQLIAEWASPNFHEADLLPFLGLLLLTAAAVGLTGRRADATDLCLFLVFSAIGLRSGRYIGLAALVMAPVAARSLSHFPMPVFHSSISPSSPSSSSSGTDLSPRVALILNWTLLVAVLIACGVKLSLPLDPQLIAAVEEQAYPVAAVDYLVGHELPGPMFNDYNWGGYLIWRLWPRYPVFVDGRADPYSDELLWDYSAIVRLRPGVREKLAQYGVNCALIPSGGGLATLLGMDPAWEQVYDDGQAAIFVRCSMGGSP
ncbi:MAG: hypothetical protein SVX38_02385 [Chloroflexota bacterium]|nr:hypothetical protein [Chloroflexota bacterium]